MKRLTKLWLLLTITLCLSELSTQAKQEVTGSGLTLLDDPQQNFSDGGPGSPKPKPRPSCPKHCVFCDLQTFNCRICGDGWYLQEVRLKATPRTPISTRQTLEGDLRKQTICAPCISGCKKCFGPDFFECYDLMSGVRQTPEGSLEPCEAQGCDQCNFEKQKMCRGCEKGFVGSPDEGDANFVSCHVCKQAKTCAICDSDLESCLQCKLGYELTSDGVCMESVSHHKCKSQEYDSMTGVCLDCLYDFTDVKTRNNYSWSTILGTCIHSCPPRCQTCEDEDLCETCKPGFRWDQNELDCTPCGVKDCLNCFEHP